LEPKDEGTVAEEVEILERVEVVEVPRVREDIDDIGWGCERIGDCGEDRGE